MTRSLLPRASLLGLTVAVLSPVFAPVFGAAPAVAGELAGGPAAPVEINRAADAAPLPELPAVGVMADVGLPDGASASLVVRPIKWLRLSGGGSYNMISSGLRAGASLLPFGWGPSLSVEGGHYFDGDANGVMRRFAGSSYRSNAVLERVGYDYANAHLGLDLGLRRVTFFIHAGFSYIRATVHNVDSAIQSEMSSGSSATTLSINKDPIIRAITPSAKLGLIVYLW
jgi:hypothetical protein